MSNFVAKMHSYKALQIHNFSNLQLPIPYHPVLNLNFS